MSDASLSLITTRMIINGSGLKDDQLVNDSVFNSYSSEMKRGELNTSDKYHCRFYTKEDLGRTFFKSNNDFSLKDDFEFSNLVDFYNGNTNIDYVCYFRVRGHYIFVNKINMGNNKIMGDDKIFFLRISDMSDRNPNDNTDTGIHLSDTKIKSKLIDKLNPQITVFPKTGIKAFNDFPYTTVKEFISLLFNSQDKKQTDSSKQEKTPSVNKQEKEQTGKGKWNKLADFTGVGFFDVVETLTKENPKQYYGEEVDITQFDKHVYEFSHQTFKQFLKVKKDGKYFIEAFDTLIEITSNEYNNQDVFSYICDYLFSRITGYVRDSQGNIIKEFGYCPQHPLQINDTIYLIFSRNEGVNTVQMCEVTDTITCKYTAQTLDSLQIKNENGDNYTHAKGYYLFYRVKDNKNCYDLFYKDTLIYSSSTTLVPFFTKNAKIFYNRFVIIFLNKGIHKVIDTDMINLHTTSMKFYSSGNCVVVMGNDVQTFIFSNNGKILLQALSDKRYIRKKIVLYGYKINGKYIYKIFNTVTMKNIITLGNTSLWDSDIQLIEYTNYIKSTLISNTKIKEIYLDIDSGIYSYKKYVDYKLGYIEKKLITGVNT